MVGDVGIAVAAGLLFGKFAGIYFFTWLAIKIKLTPMPPGMTWTNLSGIALLGGIGFTVSLFIAVRNYSLRLIGVYCSMDSITCPKAEIIIQK